MPELTNAKVEAVTREYAEWLAGHACREPDDHVSLVNDSGNGDCSSVFVVTTPDGVELHVEVTGGPWEEQ